MRFPIAAIFAGCWLAVFGGQASAQDVTLTSRDKSIEISGNLLGFDGDYYRVDTVYGELTVDSTGVLCEGPACPNLESYIAQLTFSGSRAIGRVLLPALIEGYARHAGLIAVREEDEADNSLIWYWLQSTQGTETAGLFNIRLTSSDEGFADILSNTADIAMSVREASDEETAQAKEIGYGTLTKGRQQVFIGHDALVLNVPKTSEVDEVSIDQLSKLLRSDITSWVDLDAENDEPILMTVAEGVSDLLPLVNRGLPVADRIQGLDLSDFPADRVSQGALSMHFGYRSAVPEDLRPVSMESACGMTLKPTELSLRSNELPYSFPMILYRPMRRLPEIGQQFLEFVESPTGQRVVERAGYAMATPSEHSFEEIGYRVVSSLLLSEAPEEYEQLKRAIEILRSRRMIGGGLRVTKEDEFSAASQALVRQVRQMIELGSLEVNEVLFVGYGSDEQLGDRARQFFATELEASGQDVKLASVHLGNSLPLGCPAGDETLNKRVEIWVR